MPATLAEWLDFVEHQHPQAIDMGLERVTAVLARLRPELDCPVFTVTGTNGKGSACAMLESVLRAAGYRCGLYTSPHLVRYNERVRIAGAEVQDAALAGAFAAVERVREGVPLTYFEFGTLAAFHLFAQSRPEALVLEVGLGGRLDAVNALDADCAVLTSVGIDHVEYLGPTRESIGREKAGIFRPGRPAVVADPDPPASVLEAAARIGARLLRLGHEFDYSADAGQWSYRGPGGHRSGLAWPALRGPIQLRNAAAVITALDTQRARIPVGAQDIRRGLMEVELPGRYQVLPGRPQVVLDVAHNVQAAGTLAANLLQAPFAPRTIAVFGAMRDKDLDGIVRAVAPRISRWHLATLPGPRGAAAAELAAALAAAGVRSPAPQHDSPVAAWSAAAGEAAEADRIVVFGSFVTVSGVLTFLDEQRRGARSHG